MAKPMTATGAILRTYVFENLDSKTKKSIKRVIKGDACKARSVASGRRISWGVASCEARCTMRCGKDKRRDQ